MRCASAVGALAAAVLLVGAEPAPGDAGAPACRGTAEVRPKRALVGEQILYTLRVSRRQDVEHMEWLRPLAFPGFRVEWLPGRPEEPVPTKGGVAFLAHEEHRALFAVRAGEWTLPDAVLRCSFVDPATGARRREDARLPGLRLHVDPVPKEGRPDDWSGLVGAPRLRAVPEARAVALGDAVRLSVQVSGEGNLWALPPPLAPHGVLPGADVFARPAETVFDPGPRLGVRRFFRFDIVPRETGTLVIPALRVAYYDPSARRYGAAESPPIPIEVIPASDTTLRRSGEDPRDVARSAAGPSPGPGARILAVLAAASIAVVFGIWRFRRERAHPWKPVEQALRAAARWAREGDRVAEARELARALRAALRATAPPLADLDPDALRSCAESPPPDAPVEPALLAEMADQLAALDWIRFSDEVGHPDREAARAVVARLRAGT